MGRFTRCEVLGICVLACGGTAVASPLLAQPSELRLGDIARVSATMPSLRGLVGRVVTLTDDTLALQTAEPVARIAIARTALTATERRLPTASRAKHTLVGAALGLVGGAAIGAIGGAAGSRTCVTGYDDNMCGRGFGATIGAVTGALLGVVVGTVIGASRPVERWSPIQGVDLRVSPTGPPMPSALLIVFRV